MIQLPRCPYCGSLARLVTSDTVYPGRPDYGMLWACANYPKCDAYVGCHKGTTAPLGRLANKDLRAAKQAAHAAFDRLWQAKVARDGVSKGQACSRGYEWLAKQLGLPVEQTHIGMFDVDTCRRVVAICAPYLCGKKTNA